MMIASAGVLLAAGWVHADVHQPNPGDRHGMPNFIHYSSFHVGIGQHDGPGGGGQGGGHHGGGQSHGGDAHHDNDGPGDGYNQDSEGPEFVYHPGDCIIDQEEELPPRQGGPEDCPQDGGGNQGTLIPSPSAATLGLIGLAGLIRKRRHAGGTA